MSTFLRARDRVSRALRARFDAEPRSAIQCSYHRETGLDAAALIPRPVEDAAIVRERP
jgi:hypothetical protein